MRKILLTNILILLVLCAHAQSAKDKTSYITNPSFESGTSGWVSEGLQAQSNNSFTKKSGSVYMEKWVSSGNYVGNASIYQIIKGLPNGIYQLTVAAQNLNQNSTSQKCKGVYIYADDQQTSVYTPDDYSVTFTNITGEVEIGFMANGATGNWIAVDNFRLSLIGEVDPQKVIDEISRLVEEAEKIPTDVIPDNIASALQSAIAAGKLITTTAKGPERFEKLH